MGGFVLSWFEQMKSGVIKLIKLHLNKEYAVSSNYFLGIAKASGRENVSSATLSCYVR